MAHTGLGSRLREKPFQVALLCGVMGAAFYLQPTLAFRGHEIRLSVSDVVLVALLLAVAPNWRGIGSQIPAAGWLAVGTAATVATLGFARGIAAEGVMPWALAKFAGVFVLVAYLFAGWVCARLGREGAIRSFVLCLIGTGAAALSYQIVAGLARHALSLPRPLFEQRLEAPIYNANALALVIILTMILLVLFADEVEHFSSKRARFCVGGLLVVALLLTGSVSGWLAAILCAAVLAATGEIRVHRVPLALAGCLALLLVAGYTTNRLPYWLNDAFGRVAQSVRLLPFHEFVDHPTAAECHAKAHAKNMPATVSSRVRLNCLAGLKWRSAPILGVGLGGFLASLQREPESGDIAVVHSTPLWLAAEFGLAGLGLFIAMIAFIACRLIIRARRGTGGGRDTAARFALAVVILMLGWQTMSLANELTYQRVVWFAIGLALAIPAAGGAQERANSNAASGIGRAPWHRARRSVLAVVHRSRGHRGTLLAPDLPVPGQF